MSTPQPQQPQPQPQPGQPLPQRPAHVPLVERVASLEDSFGAFVAQHRQLLEAVRAELGL